MDSGPIYQKSAEGSYDSKFITKLVKNYRSHPAIIKVSTGFCQHTFEYLSSYNYEIILRNIVVRDPKFDASLITVLITWLSSRLISSQKYDII